VRILRCGWRYRRGWKEGGREGGREGEGSAFFFGKEVVNCTLEGGEKRGRGGACLMAG